MRMTRPRRSQNWRQSGGLDGKAPKSKTRQAKNRNETKKTKVGRGIEPATGREERTGGDRKRQRN